MVLLRSMKNLDKEDKLDRITSEITSHKEKNAKKSSPTISQRECRVVNMTTEQLKQYRQTCSGFLNFVREEFGKSKEMLKIVFDNDDSKLQYRPLETYLNYEGYIEEVETMKYHPSKEGDLVFHRILYTATEMENMMRDNNINDAKITQGKIRTINALKHAGYDSKLTLNNLRKLVPDKSIPPIFGDTTIEELDQIIAEIPKFTTMNVLNIGLVSDGTLNIGHPFYPTHLLTYDIALPQKERSQRGIFQAYIYVSSPWSHTGFHIEDYNAGSINVNIGGGKKQWTSVPAEEFQKFVDALKNYLQTQATPHYESCPYFLRRKGELILHKFLDAHDIKYTVTIQDEGEIIIIPPNCPHQVVCFGDVASHTVNFFDDIWCDLEKKKLYLCPKAVLHGHGYPLTKSMDGHRLRTKYRILMNEEMQKSCYQFQEKFQNNYPTNVKASKITNLIIPLPTVRSDGIPEDDLSAVYFEVDDEITVRKALTQKWINEIDPASQSMEFKCILPECGKCFTSQEELDCHLKETESERNFKLSKHDFELQDDSSDDTKHFCEDSAKRDRPYKCPFPSCNFTSSRQVGLATHVRESKHSELT